MSFSSFIKSSALVLGVAPFLVNALEIEQLVSRNPRPPASHIVEVTHQNGQWILGAENGILSHSANGEDWSSVSVSYTKAIESVVFWNGTYYASGVDSRTLLTSTDLVNWTESHPANYPFNTRQFLIANGKLYAVGDSPDLSVSVDGLTWEEIPLPLDGRYEGLASDGSRMILVGYSFDDADEDMDGDSLEGTVLSSEDGVTWTPRLVGAPVPNSGLEDDFLSVDYVNGLFVAGGKQGFLATSPDGLTWTVQTTPFQSWLYGVAYLGGNYYFPGRQGLIHKTANFTDWEDIQTEANQTLQDIHLAGNRMLTVGRDGIVAYSDDGATWPITTDGTREFIFEVEYGDGVYVAADANAGIWWSADSESWNPAFADDSGSYLEGLVWDGSQFVGMNTFGALLTSPDGENWTQSESAVVPGRIERFRRLGDLSWAVGASGLIASSADLLSWNQIQEGDARFLDVAFGNGVYVVSGIANDNSEGVVYSSSDGVSWTMRDTTLEAENGVRLNTVAHANGAFVVLGQGYVLLTSADGVNWTSAGVQGQTPFNCAKLGVIDGQFVAPDLNGVVYTSTDGTAWVRNQARTTRAFHDIAVTDDRTVAVGSNGTIMSSPLVIPVGYAAWVEARFTDEQQDDLGISGVAADFDGDDRPNGLEYFSNTAPLVIDAGSAFEPMIVSIGDDDYPGIKITRKNDLVDATLAIRHSANLANWSNLPPDQIIEVSVTPLDAETESVVFRTTSPVAEGTASFLQIGVTVAE